MANETTKKLTNFDQLYPGRFIKAGEFQGKKVTLTIASADTEKLQGDDGKDQLKAILSFEEIERKHVMCKTNGISIKAMFGAELKNWVGKRVVFFPDVWNGEPAIRVWGSPDIAHDVDVMVTLPRRKPFKKTMHATGKKADAGTREEPATQDAPPPEDADSLGGRM